MTNGRAVLSIDFELFSHTPAYRNAAGVVDEEIGIRQTRRLLALLDRYDVQATFFVVSDIAQEHRELLRAVADTHEIGSHTHTHRHLSELEESSYLSELERSRELLSDVTGSTVEGFRAPSFDIGDEHFTFLSDAGYRYDSSVVPSRSIPGWYGGEWDRSRSGTADQFRDGAPRDVDILPVSVAPYLQLPLTGTWLRFFCARYTTLGMRLLARRNVTPVLYVHPWEFADLPAVEGVPNRVYWRTGEWMWDALESILEQPFEFVPAREALDPVEV